MRNKGTFIAFFSISFILLFYSFGFAICEEYDERAMSISASSGPNLILDLLLIDSQDRKTGFDAETNSVKEDIPCTLGYGEDYYGGSVPPTRVLEIRPKTDGVYILEINSATSTIYNLSVYFRDSAGNDERLNFIGTLSGNVAKYKINYNSASVYLTTISPDLDNDGYFSDEDCNDTNASIHPGATEVCDGVDNNCDGNIDEGLTFDVDGDGYTSPNSCAGTKNDCNDNDPNIHPGAPENFLVPKDGIDNDCDGKIDEPCAVIPYEARQTPVGLVVNLLLYLLPMMIIFVLRIRGSYYKQ